MTLDKIAPGARVFVDSTIFIYHFSGASRECRRFLERCESGDIKCFTSVIVVAEVTHRLMMIEAIARGLATPGQVARRLREKPEIIKKLLLYQEQVEQIPLMGIEILPFDLKSLIRSAELRNSHNLLTSDSLVASSAKEAGLKHIASTDLDLERVAHFELYQPSDTASEI